MDPVFIIIGVILGLVVLPFVLFFSFKFAGAGWTAGKFSYLQNYSKGRVHHGKDNE